MTSGIENTQAMPSATFVPSPKAKNSNRAGGYLYSLDEFGRLAFPELAPLSFSGVINLSKASVFSSKDSGDGQFSRSLFLALGAAFGLFASYFLGYGMRSSEVAEEAARSFSSAAAGGMRGSLGGSRVFAVAAGLALLLLAALLRSTKIVFWRRNRFAGRPEKAIAEFVADARELKISLRVARESYHLLQYHYPKPMCISLKDDLRRDLRMTPGNILSLRAGLLGRTDRLEQGCGDEAKIATVRHLLESVESAPRNGLDRAKMRQRVTDHPYSSRPVVENLEFTSASQLADPDFLRRAHFKWLRRRNADYKGFRSRITDALARPQGHHGPFRRATELSKRLAIRQEAGKVAKRVAEERSAETSAARAGWMPTVSERSPAASSTVFHGY